MLDVRRSGGGRGLRGGSVKRVDGASSGRPRNFRYQHRPVDYDHIMTAAREEREWRNTAERGAERFMAKWIAADKVRAGLRSAVVCPNVTGRTEERMVQSKRVRAGSLALASQKWHELVSFGSLVCRCHDCLSLLLRLLFVLFRFRLFAFIEGAALRSIVLRYACARQPNAVTTHCLCPLLFLVYLEFSDYFCTIAVFSLYGEHVVRFFLTDGV